MKEPAKTHRFMGQFFLCFFVLGRRGEVYEIRVASLITGGYLAPPSQPFSGTRTTLLGTW